MVQELNLYVYSVIFQSIIHYFLQMSAFKTIYSSKLLITRVTKECTKTARVHTATPSFELVEPVFQRFMQLHLFPQWTNTQPTPKCSSFPFGFGSFFSVVRPLSTSVNMSNALWTQPRARVSNAHSIHFFSCILSLHGDIKMHSSWHKCQNIPQPPGGGHVSDSWGVTRVV